MSFGEGVKMGRRKQFENKYNKNKSIRIRHLILNINTETYERLKKLSITLDNKLDWKGRVKTNPVTAIQLYN